MRRESAEVECRKFSNRAHAMGPVTCRLCQNAEFNTKEEWQEHVDEQHGGSQRYRNALFSLSALQPHVVSGQEWRAIVANYAEFLARATLDWSCFTPDMKDGLASDSGLASEPRWHPRALRACVFCARRFWREDMHEEYLAGPQCFMAKPAKVAELLSWETYHSHWPDTPAEHLQASCVPLRIGDSASQSLVLMHKRRVNAQQAELEGTFFDLKN